MASTEKKPGNAATDPGSAAVKEKVSQLLADRAKLKEQWRANNSAWSDAVAAGRLFGVEVSLPVDIERPNPGGVPRFPSRPDQESLFGSASSETSVRHVVFERLKKAGTAGITTTEMRKEIEAKLGRKLHEKTIGMTLYRLSRKGLSKRDGLTWYPTAKAAESKTPAP